MKKFARTMTAGLLLGAMIMGLTAPCVMAKSNAETVPTEVTSERMQYDAAKQHVVFKGNVHVVRPDFQIWSDTLTLYFEDKENAKKDTSGSPMPMQSGEVSRIVAKDNVRMDYDGKKGTCDIATYTTADGLLVMDGNPVLSDGDNVIKGSKILFYSEENRSEVVGGSQPVKAVFATPAGKTQGKK
ncbi:MAG: LptA/OstA family protein [Pseudomonadota bacterium]